MMKLLVFDDEAAIGRLVVRVAKAAGIAAAAVTDPGAFASQLTSDRPEIILLDLQLGCTNGVQQLNFLAKQQYAGTVVLMSGFETKVLSTARALGQSLGLNIKGVLPKPLQLTDLERIFTRLQAESLCSSIARHCSKGPSMTLNVDTALSRAFGSAPWLLRPGHGLDVIDVLSAALGPSWSVQRETDPEGDVSIIVLPLDWESLPTFILYEDAGVARLGILQGDEWLENLVFENFQDAVGAIVTETAGHFLRANSAR